MREIKTYIQSFHYDAEKTEVIAIKWETGLKEISIYHNGELCDTIGRI